MVNCNFPKKRKEKKVVDCRNTLKIGTFWPSFHLASLHLHNIKKFHLAFTIEKHFKSKYTLKFLLKRLFGFLKKKNERLFGLRKKKKVFYELIFSFYETHHKNK